MICAIKQLPIVEGLFAESSDNPQLIGGKCNGCNTYFFTIHSYPPPPFKMEPFQPYAIGLVELPENLQVICMLTGFALDSIALGTDVELLTSYVQVYSVKRPRQGGEL